MILILYTAVCLLHIIKTSTERGRPGTETTIDLGESIASVPGLSRSVRILIMHIRGMRTERGRPETEASESVFS